MADTIVEKALELLNKDVNFYFSKINSDTFRTQDKLHLVYQEFEKKDPLKPSEICKKENNDHNDKFKFDDDIVTLCIKVESILKNFNSICSTKNGFSDNTCCDYLIYWIYGELIKKNYTPYNVHWLYRKIQELLEKNQYDTNTNPMCNRNFKRVFGIENLKYKKYLHDFLEYFDSIKSILKSETSVKEYCDYMYYILQLYNNIKEACYSRIPEACPDEIKKFHNKIKSLDLSLVKNNCSRVWQEFTLSNWNAILDQLNKEQIMHVERIKGPFKYRKQINYDIFHFLDIYKEEEKSSPNKQKNVSNETTQCDKIKNYVTDEHIKLQEICKDFILYFFNFPKTKFNSIYYIDYLNYWLNEKLKNTKMSATNFIDIMDKILSYKFSSYSQYKYFKNSVYDINRNILKEMNILHNLYDEHNKFLNKSKDKCRIYDNECLSKYVTKINECYHTKNKRFYKALKKFLSIFNEKNRGNCDDKKPTEPFLICEILKQHDSDIIQQNCTSSCQTIKNTNLETFPKGENVLNELTAHEKYKKLDNKNIDELICSSYCEDFISVDDKHEKFNLLCAKMATNLKELSTVLADVTSHDDRCTYFIFWAYEKIMSILNENSSSHNNYYAINLLNQVVNTINKELPSGEKCSYNFDGTLSDWKKEKDLHDYFKNFDTIDANVDKNPNNCNKYLGYLKHIRDLYMKDLKSCCAYYTNSDPVYLEMCPKYFKCDKKYFPNSLISKLNCGNEETNPNVDEVFKGLFVDLDVVTLSKMSNRAASNYLKNLLSHLMGDKFNSAMFYSYSFLGISFLFFLLYKVIKNDVLCE
ncbi:variable surface protein Vir12 [Plasmodium vivax North Korean]|uniref:Variable surface protein Vir12 n=1 Tax=Plasmodium vivax North Korean TaxID=1035514 RepID=A0A0J9TZ02_PLAVI|nr:variable surface protein Vir12 [Plasmodium vivax North Korean]